MISNIPGVKIDKNKIGVLSILVVSSLFSISLLVFRIFYSHSATYSFLVWNLFLAWIPFSLSLLLTLKENRIKRKIAIVSLIFFWLLFFPNAPYILTDLFHLKHRPDAPFWFDLVLLLSFVSNGLILGLISLNYIQNFIEKKFSKAMGWLFTFSALFLGSFGIYLGRYQRWNSWDVITNPFALFKDMVVRIINPVAHPRTYGVTILFFVLLTLIYITFKIMGKSSKDKKDKVAF
jgi:uncharacterized membrane protein